MAQPKIREAAELLERVLGPEPEPDPDRPAVEHRLAGIGGLQTNCARHQGTRANTLDPRRHAAVANLIEIHAALDTAALDTVALAA